MTKDKSPEEEEYWGNMWGWKLSFFGLALIVLMLGLMGVRKCQLGQTFEYPTQIETGDE